MIGQNRSVFDWCLWCLAASSSLHFALFLPLPTKFGGSICWFLVDGWSPFLLFSAFPLYYPSFFVIVHMIVRVCFSESGREDDDDDDEEEVDMAEAIDGVEEEECE